jgi:formate dehydrogenase major subunit
VAKISITLDGRVIEIEEGQTILEAARQNQVDIPTLCHDPRLKPTAACRLCLVEVEKMRGPVPACNTQISPSMVIKTGSEDITESRRIALELLLSNHSGDCVSPCSLACPAGIDVQAQIAHIANGQYFAALKLIKESNPLPLVCGRVCPRFCEKKCRRTLVDGPVAINLLKRFVADMDLGSGGPFVPRVKPATGHKVAVIGGGPAGLSAAYYLALEGHSVSLFDANPLLGGMLRYGIPEYRLPKAILDKEMAAVVKICREVNCNVSLGRDFTLEGLKSRGFEAVFLALGAQSDQKMHIPGEDLPGVFSGIGFLRDVIQSKKIDLGPKVVVAGGGNTAIDAARTALRLGAKEVTIVYRRSRQEMPASAEEVEGAEQEGVKFQFLSNPLKINAKAGKAGSIECVRMALGAPDASGRRRPEPVPGSEFEVEASAVIMAVGQSIDAGGLGPDSPVKLGPRGGIVINAETMETTLSGVFSGGDCTSGPATAVEAIGAGHRAAIYMHQYLQGQKITPLEKPYNSSRGELATLCNEKFAHVEPCPRAVSTSLKAEDRKHNFAEIEMGITGEAAQKEAGRCLACGCQDVYECQLRKLATEYKVNDKHYTGKKRHWPVYENEHPYILRDQNKCILCGRCVRICDEVEGTSALGFAHRGISTTIEPSLGMPLSETGCDSCGQCVSTCPTGAIVPKVQLSKPGPFKLEKVASVCPYCGIGCRIDLNICNNQIIKVTSPQDSPVNRGNLCRHGAFEINAIQNAPRLLTPLFRPNGHLSEQSWPEAIRLAAQGLKRIKEQSGSHGLAVLSSPLLTNEENYLVQKMARVALGTNNIGCLSSRTLNESRFNAPGSNASTCSFDDILTSDFILVYNCDLPVDYHLIALKIRESLSRGSRLAVLNNHQTGLDSIAEVSLKVNNRTSLDLLQAILQYILSYDMVDDHFIKNKTAGFRDFSEHIRNLDADIIARIPWVNPVKIIELIHLYVRAKKPIIIVNGNTLTPPEMDLINDLALATGNVGVEGAGILILRSPGNAQGLLDMGVSPNYLPGQEPLTDAVQKKFADKWEGKIPAWKGKNSPGILSGIEKGEIQGLVVVGKEALGEIGSGIFAVPLFSVLIETTLPPNPPYPQVILPGATFAESEGTFTSCDRRVQHLYQAAQPPAGKPNWEIISELSTALGYPMKYQSPAGIYQEIADLVPLYGPLQENEPAGGSPQRPYQRVGGFASESGLAHFRIPEKKLPVLLRN